MKAFYAILIFLVVFLGACSQTSTKENLLETEAIYRAGYDAANDIGANSNSVVVVGQRFDGSSPGLWNNGYIYKFNASLESVNYAWNRAFGIKNSDEIALKVKVDSAGNSYVLTSENNLSYLRKYNSSGSLAWRKPITFSSQLSSSFDVALDSSGNPYVSYAEDQGREPTMGNGLIQFFILKFSPTGNLLRIVTSNQLQFTSANDAFYFRPLKLVIDNDGNFYILYNHGLVRPFSRQNIVNLSMLQIVSNGVQNWNKVIYTADATLMNNNISGDFVVTDSGKIIVAVSDNKYVYDCFVSLDPCGYINNGSYVLELGYGAELLWKKQFDSDKTGNGFIENGYSPSPSIIVDSDGSTYVTGETGASLPGYVNQGNSDIYVVKTDNLGNRLWVRQFGTINPDRSSGIAIAGNSGLYIAGVMNDGSFKGEGNKANSFVARLSRSTGNLQIF